MLANRIEAGENSVENVMKTTRLVLAVMTLFARNTNAGTQEQLEATRPLITDY
jgi:hypothetical protein